MSPQLRRRIANRKVEAVRSRALASGQIMYSLQWRGRSLTVPGVRASIREFGWTAPATRDKDPLK